MSDTRQARRIEVFFQEDKHGRTRAYRFSRTQFRSFPISVREAEAAILEGRADLLTANPFAAR